MYGVDAVIFRSFIKPFLLGATSQDFSMRSRADVLQSIQAKIRLLHLAYSTEVAYCGWVGRYYDFCLNLPKPWSPERKAEAFLTSLAGQRRRRGPDAKSGALGPAFSIR